MARKRMIDPGIWQSEDFSKLSTLAKLVFIGLFSNADDEGRGRAKAAYIKSTLFPYDEGMRVIDIDKTLSEIASNMSVTFYLHDENEYYSLDKWDKWQKVDKPTPSNLPAFDETCKPIRGTVGEPSPKVRGGFPPNRIEKNRINCANELFERLWSSYPSKKGKGKVSNADKLALLEIGEEEMNRAVKRYKDGLKADQWREPQNGSTFFHSGYIDYLDRNYVTEARAPVGYDGVEEL